MMRWQRSADEELDAPMGQAIRDGRSLTDEYMLKVHGLKPAPPGALT